MKTRSQKKKKPTTTEETSKTLSAITKQKQKQKQKQKATKKRPTGEDPKKPKKPPTAFFYFLEDFRKTYQEERPDVKTMQDIGKACGEKWKTMNFEEKVQYYDIATEKRAEFDKAMAAYNKRKESGEGSDLSDE